MLGRVVIGRARSFFLIISFKKLSVHSQLILSGRKRAAEVERERSDGATCTECISQKGLRCSCSIVHTNVLAHLSSNVGHYCHLLPRSRTKSKGIKETLYKNQVAIELK